MLELEEGRRITALKNVTANEEFFLGHFPGAPVMPGVLIVEALAQAGAVLLLHEMDDRAGKLIYFTGIDDARFRRTVIPGDQLRLEVETMRIKGETVQVRGKGSVAGRPVCEAVLMFTMIEA